jgi:hypothetical protein
MNSSLTLDQSRALAEQLTSEAGADDNAANRAVFIRLAFETVLNRSPLASELTACQAFLQSNTVTIQATDQNLFPAGGPPLRREPSSIPHQRARENLIHVLFSHNDFVTIR